VVAEGGDSAPSPTPSLDRVLALTGLQQYLLQFVHLPNLFLGSLSPHREQGFVGRPTRPTGLPSLRALYARTSRARATRGCFEYSIAYYKRNSAGNQVPRTLYYVLGYPEGEIFTAHPFPLTPSPDPLPHPPGGGMEREKTCREAGGRVHGIGCGL
jgi:hypothetical protein